MTSSWIMCGAVQLVLVSWQTMHVRGAGMITSPTTPLKESYDQVTCIPRHYSEDNFRRNTSFITQSLNWAWKLLIYNFIRISQIQCVNVIGSPTRPMQWPLPYQCIILLTFIIITWVLIMCIWYSIYNKQHFGLLAINTLLLTNIVSEAKNHLNKGYYLIINWYCIQFAHATNGKISCFTWHLVFMFQCDYHVTEAKWG